MASPSTNVKRKTMSDSQSASATDAAPLTVGDVARGRDTVPTCSEELLLSDVSDLLLSAGQTAATVVNSKGEPTGLITEDDILMSYLHGAPWDCTVGEWLRGRTSRASLASPVALEGKKVSDLKRYAKSLGISTERIDAVDDDDSPKESLIKLIGEHEEKTRAKASVTATKRAKPTPVAAAAATSEASQPASSGTIAEAGRPLAAAAPFADDFFQEFAAASDQLLREAIPRMLAPAPIGRSMQSGFGHLMVADPAGAYQGVLSTLDVVRKVAEESRRDFFEDFGMSTVADIMEPVQSLPPCTPGSTMQHVMQAVLMSPTRTTVVRDESGVRGVATASDMMAAFRDRVCRSQDAFDWMTRQSGLLGVGRRQISADALLDEAAAAMSEMRSLLAVRPGTDEVVGIVSPPQLVRGRQAVPEPDQETPLSEKPQEGESIPVRSSPEAEAPVEVKVEKVERPKKKRRRHHKKIPHPLTVGEVVAQRETAMVSATSTLGDACDKLVESGRTAAVVVDREADGTVRGVFTENDVLQALIDDAPSDLEIKQWLRGGDARLPGFMVPTLTLPPNATLPEAAACMAYMSEEGDLSLACHHLLVSAGKPKEVGEDRKMEAQLRVLSALDIALGLVNAAVAESSGGKRGAAAKAAEMSVRQVMKPRYVVPMLKLTQSLAESFRELRDARQNAAFVLSSTADEVAAEVAEAAELAEHKDEEAKASHAAEAIESEEEKMKGFESVGDVFGVITTSDAIRAFSESQSGERTSLGGWLRGLEGYRTGLAKRTISADALLVDAVRAMADSGTHHLLVLKPDTKDETIGIISALDIVCKLGALYYEEARAVVDVEAPQSDSAMVDVEAPQSDSAMVDLEAPQNGGETVQH